MAKILPISEIKKRRSELVTGVHEETLDVLSDPDMMAQIRASESCLAKGGKGQSFEDVFGVPLRRAGKRARKRHSKN